MAKVQPGRSKLERNPLKVQPTSRLAGKRRTGVERGKKTGSVSSFSRRRSRRPRERTLQFDVEAQPNDVTCGPTCLHGVYRYYGDEISLSDVIAQVPSFEGGGTLAVSLGCHALARGYQATIYTYNLHVFDPTWFKAEGALPDKLRAQMLAKSDPKLHVASNFYLRYLSLGGELRFEELTPGLLRRHLFREQPILTGLSATYLYECQRELNNEYDDVQGEPSGHFVVLSGYDNRKREVLVSDPLRDNPRFYRQRYRVTLRRLISSILLGIVTYDANLLIITPPIEPEPG
jgi:hypothetical protein